ncbi:MAG TPA: chromate resistance protein ChrB domain-containing protein [Candidatus Eisenbacteria bacterium]|nr:chromate resistance protein ChrB domain-containing protein [Candidatus Eisenbacteria bacterium]
MASSWLLFIHQLPQKPDYLRVKVSRQLRALGARPIKNSVYVLPHSDSATTALEKLIKDVAREGGEAALCQARFVAGRSDEDIAALFFKAWEAEYLAIARAAERLHPPVAARTLRALAGRLARLKAVDQLGVPARAMAQQALARLTSAPEPSATKPLPAPSFRGRTWVTRRGVLIDRMASAWLVRRFVDAKARFKFVAPGAHEPATGEVRFDMPGGEFTHAGDRCTFEVLFERFAPGDLSLRQIAEIVHDIDLGDGKFGRAEADGIGRAVFGLAQSTADDRLRLGRSASLFDSLYASFEKKPALGAALARPAGSLKRERTKEKPR